MFTGLTFFGIPFSWFLRLAEAIVIAVLVFSIVTFARYYWRTKKQRETQI
jgi:hypothetical protein